jgi:uncharacterized protein (TIGR02996 family)
VEVTEVELLEAIRRSPEDDTCRLVYGDWASQHGFSRGELIALQCHPERDTLPEIRQRSRELLDRHAREWLGPLAAASGSVDHVFERGFLLHPPAVPTEVLQAHRDVLLRLSPTVYETGEVAYRRASRELHRGQAHGPAGPLGPVAIKGYRRSSDPYQLKNRRARLEREGATTGRLAHPHLVEALSWAYLGGEIALVLEWIEGLDLCAVLASCRGSAPPGEAFATAVTWRVAAAVEALHRSCSVLHDAVRPDHVMVGFDGQVKLIDLGSARSFHSSVPEEPPFPQDRSVRWTYRSPESTGRAAAQMADPVPGRPSQPPAALDLRAPVDARSDLFSVGCLLVELCLGENPFVTAGGEEYGPYQMPPFSLRSAALEELARQCLQRDADDRPSSARELAEALRQIARREGWSLEADAIAATLRSRARRG